MSTFQRKSACKIYFPMNLLERSFLWRRGDLHYICFFLLVSLFINLVISLFVCLFILIVNFFINCFFYLQCFLFVKAVSPVGHRCLVPVRLSPRPSRSIDFGDVSRTNDLEQPRQKQNAHAPTLHFKMADIQMLLRMLQTAGNYGFKTLVDACVIIDRLLPPLQIPSTLTKLTYMLTICQYLQHICDSTAIICSRFSLQLHAALSVSF